MTKIDYMDEDNIHKYCQSTVYPYQKLLPSGWEKYCGYNPRILCGKVMAMIKVPNGLDNKWYWYDKVANIRQRRRIILYPYFGFEAHN